jgi:hypothetical protein
MRGVIDEVRNIDRLLSEIAIEAARVNGMQEVIDVTNDGVRG